MFDLNNKIFGAEHNSESGEVSDQTRFHYYQQDKMIWAEYGGGEIIKGFLIGKWVDDEHIEFTYQHLNQDLENRLGRCKTQFSLKNGKLYGNENWQWLDGDKEQGTSLIKEL